MSKQQIRKKIQKPASKKKKKKNSFGISDLLQTTENSLA